MKERGIWSRRRRCVVLASVCLSGAAAQANITWNTTNGNWSTIGNWTPAREPNSSDTVLVNVASATSYTVTLDIAGSFGTLELGSGTGTVILSQASGFNLSGATEEVGFNGEKGAHSQSNGTNTLSQALIIGDSTNSFNIASTGTYAIKGGTIHVSSTGTGSTVGEFIGDQANGTLNQSGGINTVDSALYIGTQNGGNGTYSESAGSATVGLSTSSNNMYLGYSANTTGTYTISNAASMTVHGGIYVGGTSSLSEGTGTLNVNGGTLSCTSNLDVWENGSLTMTAGSLTTGNLVAVAGGILNLNGGTVNAASLTDSYGSNINISGAAITTGLVTVSAVTTLNLNSGSLAASGGISVSGDLNGSGTTTAAVTVNSGGNISPNGTLTVGGLTTTSGAILNFDPGDQITVTNSNSLNFNGPTTLNYNGVANGTFPLINYSGLTGPIGNLDGPANIASETFTLVNNPSAHQIQMVVRRIGNDQTIAISGELAPGGGTFDGFGDFSVEESDELPLNGTYPTLNNHSQAVFTNTTNSYSAGGVFLGNGGSLSAVIRSGQSAPSGGTFSDFGVPSMNNNGQIIFGADTSISNENLYFASTSSEIATQVYTVAAENQAAPGGGTFSGIGGAVINGNGTVAFSTFLNGSAPNNQMVCRWDGPTDPLVLIAQSNNIAPGGATMSDVEVSGMDNSGNVAVFASLNAGTSYGIFIGNGGALKNVVTTGQSSGNGTYSSITADSMNASGEIAFASKLTGSSDGAANGVFLWNGSTITTIARANSSMPGYSSTLQYEGVVLNSAGQVAFASYTNTSNSRRHHIGIFRGNGTSLQDVALVNNGAPGGEFYSSLGTPQINSSGDVAYYADLAPTSGGTADNAALYETDTIDYVPIIRTGQVLQASAVTAIMEDTSENDYGQVAYTVQLADGITGNFLFTPALHWRTAGNGNWDTASNWTLSLTPAEMHDVYLDQPNTTITGPAGSVVVNSLTIGGNGGPVTFNMSAGSLTILSALTIAADGSSMNVDKATLGLPIFANSATMILDGTTNFATSASNTGTLTIGGLPNWPAGSTFTNTGGAATFNSDNGSSSSFPLAVATGGGSVTFDSSQHLAGLSIFSGASVIVGGPAILRIPPFLATNSLTFGGGTDAWQGLLDLTKYSMIVHNGDPVAITNQIKEGLNAGAGYWNGTAGIISSSAAADTSLLTALGSRMGGIVFDGENTTSSDVLVKYTYYGDADLNGTVNGADYQQIDAGFGMNLTGWYNGDFNYDGIIDGSDYSLIDNTFNELNATGASPLAIIANSTNLIPSPAATSVPEPMTLSWLGFGAIAILRRRRQGVPATDR